MNAVFVKLADTLVDGYDTAELLQHLVEKCVELLDCDGVGLLLADSAGNLQVIASTSEAAELVEIMQLNAGQGPCVECFITGEPVSVPAIDDVRERWPEFAEAALAGGYRSIYATPLRLRGKILGAMNLFRSQVGELNDRDIATARALTDVATIGLLQERAARESTVVTEQLQLALEGRVLIEQAKGILSEAHSLSLEEAFDWLRDHARRNRLSLRAVAQGLANRTLDPTSIQLRKTMDAQ